MSYGVLKVARREAKEEVGLNVLPESLQLIHVVYHHALTPGPHNRVSFFLRASSGWQGEPQNMEPDKCSELAWYPLSELPDNIGPVVAHALKKIDARETYSSFGF